MQDLQFLSEPQDACETGRRLGHDMYRFGRNAPCAAWPASVVEGFHVARALGARRRAPNCYERKWLQLRLGALQRRRAVSERVTPAFLADIDVWGCPVLRVPLTKGLRAPTDWSIDRLNNDGAYAPSNLVVMSTQANQAKGHRTFDEVLALSRSEHATDGLAPGEWLRLAALMLGPCFAAEPHKVPSIASPVAIPRFTVRMTMQQVQHLFACHAARSAGKNALVRQFKPACRDDRALSRLRMLADVVHDGLKGLEPCWDVWLRAEAMDRLVAWRSALDDVSWAAVGEISRHLIGARRVASQRLSEWRLETRGYLAVPASSQCFAEQPTRVV